MADGNRNREMQDAADHKRKDPTQLDPDAPSKAEQKDQQRSPDLQSYTSGGGDGKAADPEQNLIIENDPRYKRGPDDETPRRRPDAL